MMKIQLLRLSHSSRVVTHLQSDGAGGYPVVSLLLLLVVTYLVDHQLERCADELVVDVVVLEHDCMSQLHHRNSICSAIRLVNVEKSVDLHFHWIVT